MSLARSKHASLRKKVLVTIYRLSDGDMAHSVSCAEISNGLGLPLSVDEIWLIIVQLSEKGLITYRDQFADDRGRCRVGLLLFGIEEAEKMERTWFKQFYEDHVVIWSLVLLVIGFILSTVSGVVNNLSHSPTVINIPEQKPPVINVVVPDQKEAAK